MPASLGACLTLELCGLFLTYIAPSIVPKKMYGKDPSFNEKSFHFGPRYLKMFSVAGLGESGYKILDSAGH